MHARACVPRRFPDFSLLSRALQLPPGPLPAFGQRPTARYVAGAGGKRGTAGGGDSGAGEAPEEGQLGGMEGGGGPDVEGMRPGLDGIDCVLVSHYHLDHVGALPYLTEVDGKAVA